MTKIGFAVPQLTTGYIGANRATLVQTMEGKTAVLKILKE